MTDCSLAASAAAAATATSASFGLKKTPTRNGVSLARMTNGMNFLLFLIFGVTSFGNLQQTLIFFASPPTFENRRPQNLVAPNVGGGNNTLAVASV